MADNSKAKSNAAKKGGIFKFFREVKVKFFFTGINAVKVHA